MNIDSEYSITRQKMLSGTIFESITADYSYGQYSDFKVIIMTRNSYINATKLCSKYNKQFKHWLENNSSKELISEISSAGIPADEKDVMITITGGRNSDNETIRGTYVHPLLVPHIASWISPKFAIKVSRIVNDFIVSEYKASITQKDLLISQKDDKIDQLLKETKEQTKELENIRQINIEQSKEIRELLGYTKEINEDINTLLDLSTEQIEESEIAKTETRNIINDRINTPINACHIENMAIIKSTDPNCTMSYNMIRGIYSYVKLTIGKLTGTKFNRMTVNNLDPWKISTVGDSTKYNYVFIKAFSNVPNARHLFRAFKEYKNSDTKVIESSDGTKFSISVSESKLLDHIQNIFDSRLTIQIEERDILRAKEISSKKINNIKSKSKTLKKK